MQINFSKSIFPIIAILTILICGFLAFNSLEEWWSVSMKKETGLYPWGQINDNSWYYINPTVYSKVMLTEFILLSASICLTIFFMFRRNKKIVSYCLGTQWIIIFAIFINTKIQ